MAADHITELRLTAFKSYRAAVLPIAPLTVFIGRNGGGKSNALDGLEVLSRLSKGGDIRDALDGARRDAGPVRGGIEGCPPIVLGGVFHLDPVPQLMRQYVPEQDVVLRRNGENLSATIARLHDDGGSRFDDLVDVIRGLPEYEVRALEVGRGEFGEVMLALSEVKDDSPVTVPARQMSDGMLRMMAIVTALLAGGTGVAIEGSASVSPVLTLVLEELENGLHPTQAARMLELIKSARTEQASRC